MQAFIYGTCWRIFQGWKKYWEADVVDGIVDGVYKEYTEDEDNVLEVIEYEKYSLGNGLELLIIKIAKMKGGKLKFVTQFFYIFV